MEPAVRYLKAQELTADGHSIYIYHAAATLAGASTTPGYALRVGEERKVIAHAGACRAAGVSLCVIALAVVVPFITGN